MRYVELILAITVPVTVVYLLKMVGASSAGTLCFMRLDDEKINLNNRKSYAVFLYFNFFADCFLGIASCIIRFVKATCLNLVYMARLDCSFLGRPIERFDLGYAAYVSYLHMEVAHTNPVMLAFCYTLYDDVVKKRPKHCYDDECCIGPGELDDDEQDKTSKTDVEKEPSPKITDRNENGSTSKKSGKEKRPPIATVEEDDIGSDRGSSIRKIQPKSKSPNSSITSDKSNQKSKPKKIDLKEDIKEEEEDGGPRVPTISTIARLIPEKQPRLPKPSAPVPDVPRREDLHDKDDDDDFDDDGGLKPPSISTISTRIPKEASRVMPIQGKSPPPIPKREDIIDEENEEDDDGGINPAVIAKRKKELEEKKKKKEQEKSKKKSMILDQDEDDDGGARKTKPNPKVKPNKTSVKPIIFEDEDEDGGVSKQKQLAAEKKKKQQEEKKKKKEQKKALKAQDDDDEDDDGGVRRKEPTKKKNESTKTSSKPKVVKDTRDDYDEDGGPTVKSYDTIRSIMPPQQPVLDSKTKKPPSPEFTDDGSMRISSKQQVQPLLTSYDTVGRIVANISTNSRGVTQESNYDVLPTDEERAKRTSVIYSSPLKDTTSKSSQLPLLRTTSYREAQQSTPPAVQRRRAGESSARSGSNTNEDSSHYSEITDDTVPQGIINRSYSNSGSIRSTSNHSIKQHSKYPSEKTLKEEQQTEESGVTTEQEDEEEQENTDEKSEEEEEEQEEESKPRKQPVQKKAVNAPDVSTSYLTIAHLVDPIVAKRLSEAQRKKQARFRWFLAYTIINNYHLFDLRKQAETRLAQLRIQRSIAEEKPPGAGPAVAPQAFTIAQMSHSPGAKPVDTQPRSLTRKRLGTPEPPAPIDRSHLTVSGISARDELPQSPAERYIAIRSCMLYDVNDPRTSNNVPISATSARQRGPATRSYLDIKKTRSQYTPSDSTNESKRKRPPYQRQESQGSSSTLITGIASTPIFQSIPESGTLTDDYSLSNYTPNLNTTTLRSQMSHAQHMQAWRQKQMRKFQKNRPYRYVYGQPPPRPMEEKISTAAILTPRVIGLNDQSQFRFPPEPKNIDPKTKKPNEPPISSASSSHHEDHDREKSIHKKPIETKVTIAHRKGSSSNFSNVTEV